MECVDAPRSADTLSRMVAAYANGCAFIITVDGEVGDPVDCDNMDIGAGEWLNMAHDEPGTAMRIQGKPFAIADICDEALRMTCDQYRTVEEMFKESIMDNGDEVATIRVALVTDLLVDCIDCAIPNVPLMDRVLASFIRSTDETHVLVVPANTEDEELIGCDVDVPFETLIASALVPVGDCGMWAWRIVQT